jgi:phosphate starvation-inducible PhoH-like protein
MEYNLSRQRAVKHQQRQNMASEANTINFNQIKPVKSRPVNLIPRTRNQEKLVLALQNDLENIVITTGPAGTGKTYLCMLAAVKALKEGDCERIVMTRPAVEVEDEKHGFLPGNLVAKMEPWTRPLLDVLREYYRSQDILTMIDNGVIEIAPLAFMRGRTFKNSWVVADEMQNATPGQCKMLLTRIGKDSKIVLTGDIEQTDRNRGDNGLIDLVERLRKGGVKGISLCELEARDVQRHPIIGSILKLYSD